MCGCSGSGVRGPPPRLLVPDNLKSGVHKAKRSTLYETGAAPVLARVRSPESAPPVNDLQPGSAHAVGSRPVIELVDAAGATVRQFGTYDPHRDALLKGLLAIPSRTKPLWTVCMSVLIKDASPQARPGRGPR